MNEELNKVEAKLGAEAKPSYDKLEQDVNAIYKAEQAKDVETVAKELEQAAADLKAALKYSEKYPILHEISEAIVPILEALAKKVRTDKNVEEVGAGMHLLAEILSYVLPLN